MRGVNKGLDDPCLGFISEIQYGRKLYHEVSRDRWREIPL